MRRLYPEEMRKRGCAYCADMRKKRVKRENIRYEKICTFCVHDNGCPYTELDPYDTYDAYLKANSLKLKLPPD